MIRRRIRELKLVDPLHQHVDGTSFAAPLVSGAVAQMLEAHPGLRPAEIRSILVATARVPDEATRGRARLLDPEAATDAARLALGVPDPRSLADPGRLLSSALESRRP